MFNPDSRQGLSDSINAFAEALRTWRDETSSAATGGSGGSKWGHKVANGAPPARAMEDDDGPY